MPYQGFFVLLQHEKTWIIHRIKYINTQCYGTKENSTDSRTYSAQEILPGTVIHIPANVKHWHGAAKDSWFAHLAFEVPGENSSNEWLEPVSDEEYNKLK